MYQNIIINNFSNNSVIFLLLFFFPFDQLCSFTAKKKNEKEVTKKVYDEVKKKIKIKAL